MNVGWYVSVHSLSAYRCVRRVLCPFARGMRGPPVFCPKVSHPVVKLAHGVWTQDYPIDRGKKKSTNILYTKVQQICTFVPLPFCMLSRAAAALSLSLISVYKTLDRFASLGKKTRLEVYSA